MLQVNIKDRRQQRLLDATAIRDKNVADQLMQISCAQFWWLHSCTYCKTWSLHCPHHQRILHYSLHSNHWHTLPLGGRGMWSPNRDPQSSILGACLEDKSGEGLREKRFILEILVQWGWKPVFIVGSLKLDKMRKPIASHAFLFGE